MHLTNCASRITATKKDGYFRKRRDLKIMIMVCILFFNLNMLSANDRWREYLKQDWTELKRNLTFRTAIISGGWLAGMYMVSAWDEDMNTLVKPLYRGGFTTYFDAVNELGNAPYAIPISLGITGLSLIGNDAKFQDAAFTSSESMIATGIVTALVKAIIGRNRPDENKGPRSFHPFSGFDSFPSGHTSTAFALVTPWVFYYPRPLTYLLFILPASTGIARMIYDRHWATDVISGGLVGFVIGASLASWHKNFAEEKKYYTIEQSPRMLFSFTWHL